MQSVSSASASTLSLRTVRLHSVHWHYVDRRPSPSPTCVATCPLASALILSQPRQDILLCIRPLPCSSCTKGSFLLPIASSLYVGTVPPLPTTGRCSPSCHSGPPPKCAEVRHHCWFSLLCCVPLTTSLSPTASSSHPVSPPLPQASPRHFGALQPDHRHHPPLPRPSVSEHLRLYCATADRVLR
jgi:hypothetical protein